MQTKGLIFALAGLMNTTLSAEMARSVTTAPDLSLGSTRGSSEIAELDPIELGTRWDAVYAETRPIEPGEASATESGNTPAFQFFDSTSFNNKPDLSVYKFPKIFVTGHHTWTGQWPNYDKTAPDEEATRSLARKAEVLGAPLVVDIEHWTVDIREAPKTDVEKNMAMLMQIVDWVYDEAPGVKMGFYGLMPIRDYWTTYNYLTALERQDSSAWWANNLDKFRIDYEAWQEANEFLSPLAEKVDFLAPSLYTFYDDQDGWNRVAVAVVQEARERFNKPVIPFLWMEYHNSNKDLVGQQLPADYWQMQLDTMKEVADGAVIWGGWSPNHEGKFERTDWNKNAEWWKVLEQELLSNETFS